MAEIDVSLDIIICVCVALCDPMDCSPPGSSVHRVFQARILGWVAVLADGFFTTEPPGNKICINSDPNVSIRISNLSPQN